MYNYSKFLQLRKIDTFKGTFRDMDNLASRNIEDLLKKIIIIAN